MLIGQDSRRDGAPVVPPQPHQHNAHLGHLDLSLEVEGLAHGGDHVALDERRLFVWFRLVSFRV